MRLFLDGDGVLADLYGYLEGIYGLPYERVYPILGHERFWREMKEHGDLHFKLAELPEGRMVYEAVKHLCPSVLTGYPDGCGEWVTEEKLRWYALHFPGVPVIVCPSKNKRNYMGPGDVLVDDRLKYAHLWEEAGGVFILHRTAAETIAELERLGVL